MLKLSAYSNADLQKFKNLLLQIERERLSVAEAMSQVEASLGAGRIETARRPRRGGSRPPVAPRKRCPEKGCSGLMRIKPADDASPELAIWECPVCRYSTFEGKTFGELVEEVS